MQLLSNPFIVFEIICKCKEKEEEENHPSIVLCVCGATPTFFFFSECVIAARKINLPVMLP